CEFLITILTPDCFFLYNFGGTDRSHFLIPRFRYLPSPIRIPKLVEAVSLDQSGAYMPLRFVNALGFAQRLSDAGEIDDRFRLLHIRSDELYLLDLARREAKMAVYIRVPGIRYGSGCSIWKLFLFSGCRLNQCQRAIWTVRQNVTRDL